MHPKHKDKKIQDLDDGRFVMHLEKKWGIGFMILDFNNISVILQKLEYEEKTTVLLQLADKLYHMK